jgi:hypothetical protein
MPCKLSTRPRTRLVHSACRRAIGLCLRLAQPCASRMGRAGIEHATLGLKVRVPPEAFVSRLGWRTTGARLARTCACAGERRRCPVFNTGRSPLGPSAGRGMRDALRPSCVQISGYPRLERRRTSPPQAGKGRMVDPFQPFRVNADECLGFHGQEGVNGSSPLEGFCTIRAIGLLFGATCATCSLMGRGALSRDPRFKAAVHVHSGDVDQALRAGGSAIRTISRIARRAPSPSSPASFPSSAAVSCSGTRALLSSRGRRAFRA